MKSGLTFLPLNRTVFDRFRFTKTGFKTYFRNQSGARSLVLDVLLALALPLPLTLQAFVDVPPGTEQSQKFKRVTYTTLNPLLSGDNLRILACTFKKIYFVE